MLTVGFVLLGFLTGMLSGALGVGGGFILVPLLGLSGIPYNIAIGTSLFYILFVSITGTISHLRQKHVNFKLGMIMLAGSLPGAEIGAQLLQLLKESNSMDTVINAVYFVLLAFVSFIMFRSWKEYGKKTEGQPAKPPDLANYRLDLKLLALKKTCFRDIGGHCVSEVNIAFIAGLGLVIGMLAGLLGIGGGIIASPVSIYFLKIPAGIIAGTSLFQILFTALYGSFTHYLKNNVNLETGALMAIGGIAGTMIGSRITEKIRGRKIRLCFAVISSATALVILLRLLNSIR